MRQHQPQRFPERRQVIVSDELHQLQQIRRNFGPGNKAVNGLQSSRQVLHKVGHLSVVLQKDAQDHAFKLRLSSERHQHASSGRKLSLQTRRHAVVVRPWCSRHDGDLDDLSTC